MCTHLHKHFNINVNNDKCSTYACIIAYDDESFLSQKQEQDGIWLKTEKQQQITRLGPSYKPVIQETLNFMQQANGPYEILNFKQYH